ncbi:hypothetical protein FB45DRAFT_1106615 [Roridomyces roridus]|uniref:Peroxidase n=1 Tax=Roridomyces roridus TaxID=1738132 RepID=A0AAD7FCK9_9AGAR|nr:hypothetical protein FB45DRAFT_1106615 [Roridomyces roridus]
MNFVIADREVFTIQALLNGSMTQLQLRFVPGTGTVPICQPVPAEPVPGAGRVRIEPARVTRGWLGSRRAPTRTRTRHTRANPRVTDPNCSCGRPNLAACIPSSRNLVFLELSKSMPAHLTAMFSEFRKFLKTWFSIVVAVGAMRSSQWETVKTHAGDQVSSATIATFLAAVQAQIIALSYQDNSTSLRVVVNVFGFAGVLLDVTAACLGLMTSTVLQRNIAAVEKQLDAIQDAPPHQLHEIIRFLEARRRGSKLASLLSENEYPDLLRRIQTKTSARMAVLDRQLTPGANNSVPDALTYPPMAEGQGFEIEAISEALTQIHSSASIGRAANGAMLLGVVCFFGSVIFLAVSTQPRIVWIIAVAFTGWVVVGVIMGLVLLIPSLVRNVQKVFNRSFNGIENVESRDRPELQRILARAQYSLVPEIGIEIVVPRLILRESMTMKSERETMISTPWVLGELFVERSTSIDVKGVWNETPRGGSLSSDRFRSPYQNNSISGHKNAATTETSLICFPSLLSGFYSPPPPPHTYGPHPSSTPSKPRVSTSWDSTGECFASFIQPCDSFLFEVDGPGDLSGRSNAADWIRTAYHDMATHDVEAGTGGLDGSIRFGAEQLRPENIGTGFSNTFAVISIIGGATRSQSGINPTVADTLALATVIAIENCGGPEIAFRGGRVDATEPNDPGVPQPQQDLDSHIASFAKQGFTQTEMIGLVACGHTFGGVQHSVFPDIVNVLNDPNDTEDVAHFDSTFVTFDNNIATEYMSGTTQNPLVVGFNDTTNSDKRIFGSDGNVTMSSFAESPNLFASTCSSLFARMLDTVPSGVELTDVLTALPVKPAFVEFSLANSSLELAGQVRFWNKTQSEVGTVQMLWDDHLGGTGNATLQFGGTGKAMGGHISSAWYGFNTSDPSNTIMGLDPTAGVERLRFVVNGEVEDQGGVGFAVQDAYMFSQTSCVRTFNASTGVTTGRLDVAVRTSANLTRLYVEAKGKDASGLPIVVETDIPRPAQPVAVNPAYDLWSLDANSTLGLFTIGAEIGGETFSTTMGRVIEELFWPLCTGFSG